MKKTLIITLPLLALSLPVLLALASRSVPIDASDSVRNVVESSAVSGLSPRAVIDQETHDFGIMDPLETATHSFVIRNEGQGPLKLKVGSTTCKCTVSDITCPVIEPGGSGQVRITWNTGRLKPVYAHGATILTNDPRRKSIDLRIRGSVRVQLGASPAEIVLDGVEPDQPKTAWTWIYSQVWDSMTLKNVRCSWEPVQWEIEPVDPSERPELKAKSAYRLTIKLPAGLPEGFFQEMLTCDVRSTAGGEMEKLELRLSGKVLRRLALYGPGIDQTGTLDLGILPTGRGVQRRWLLKVRDPAPDLIIQSIQTLPEFLDVQVVPYHTESEASGLYHLVVSVPDTAPPCAFRGAEVGRIRLLVEHPRISDLELNVRFAVTGGR